MAKKITLKVSAIKQGTVIDHIPPGQAFKIVKILNLENGKEFIMIGMNFGSKKYGRKDIVKIENRELKSDEANAISLIAPIATLNIIRNFKVVKKTKVKVPKLIKRIIRCLNPNCITRHEDVQTKFHVISTKPLTIKCHYCERITPLEEITFL